MTKVRRHELLILSLLTVAFLVAVAAFVVGWRDNTLGYADVGWMMIAIMTYLGCVELTWYITEKESE